jgi:hypothetical protein
MIKRILIILSLALLTNCGFEAIYSSKNDSKILIKKIQMDGGNKKINRKIVSALDLKTSDEKNAYDLLLSSNKKIDIVSKDTTGTASVYKTTIEIKISLIENNKIKRKRNFESSFTYNNIDNKFDLSEYKKNIETNLIQKLTEEIFIFLKS